MPVEFSGAAYRFGHSMVRADYELNRRREAARAHRRQGRRPRELEHLGGFRRLPIGLAIDWAFFFKLSAAAARSRAA